MKIINFESVALVHRIFTEGKRKKGGADKIIEYISNFKNVLLIEHPLSALKETTSQSFHGVVVSKVAGGKIEELERVRLPVLPIPLNWILELFFNIFYIFKNIPGNPVLISADPLNAITGAIIPWKFSKKYFHCVDFSEKRFNSRILNFFYRTVFNISLRASDIVGVVSNRILDRIKSSGGKKNKETYLLYVPNSPEFKNVPLDKKEPSSIICTGGAIIEKYDYEKIVEVVRGVKPAIPNLKFYAVGGLEQDLAYVRKIKGLISKYNLTKNFIFTGFLDPKEVESLLIKSKVGISFYSESVSYYTYFGDSLKIREYALYGIPTIGDGNSATDKEMCDAGAGILARSIEDASVGVLNFLTNDRLFNEYQKNCIFWAKSMDKSKILKNLYGKLFS